MQSNIHSDNDRAIDEVLITREYIHQVSDSLHQQIWEARRVLARCSSFFAMAVIELAQPDKADWFSHYPISREQGCSSTKYSSRPCL